MLSLAAEQKMTHMIIADEMIEIVAENWGKMNDFLEIVEDNICLGIQITS